MLRVLIIADRPNWAFSERANQLRRYAPADMTIETLNYDEHSIDAMCFHKYDVVFVLPTNLVGPLRRIWNAAKIPTPLVASHNSGRGRRHWVLLETLMAADYTVVNNYTCWANMRAIVDENKFPCCNISNGVDLSTFTPTRPIGDRPHTILWSSSMEKVEPDTASELLDPNKGDVKGYKVVLDPLRIGVESVGNGWSTNYLLVQAGKGYSRDQMTQYYNSGSYLVCASHSEGTPNIALEGAACGCVVVTTPVGNMPELITDGIEGLFCRRNVSDMWAKLQTARQRREEISRHMLKAIQTWDWKIRSQWFYSLFRRCAVRDWPKPFTYITTHPQDI